MKSQRLVWLSLLALGLLLAACIDSSVPLTEPQTLADPLVIAVEEELTPVEPAVRLCAAELDLPIVFRPASADGQLDLLVTWTDSPPDGKAVPLGRETLVLVAHTDNPLFRIESSLVLQIWRGEISDWSAVNQQAGDLGLITLIAPPAGSQSMTLFGQWLAIDQLYYQATLAGSHADQVRLAEEDPASLTWLPSALVTEKLKRLPVSGDSTSLTAPILAITADPIPAELSGLLNCLVDGSGADLLGEIYLPYP